jgi:hypothetical protein
MSFQNAISNKKTLLISRLMELLEILDLLRLTEHMDLMKRLKLIILTTIINRKTGDELKNKQGVDNLNKCCLLY